MDVLKHIVEEHEKFKKIASEIEAAKRDKKKELFRDLYSEVYGHHEAEEKVVFPLVKEKADEEDEGIILEMIEEHSVGKYQFSVLERTSVDNETWDAKFTVLKEILEHHMDEEEEDFNSLARKLISEEKLKEIFEEFEDTHEKYKKEKKSDLS